MRTFFFVLFSCIWIFCTIPSIAQQAKPNTIFVQMGTASFISASNYPDVVINTSLDFERIFYRKNSVQIGGHAGLGVWVAPMGFLGFENSEIFAHHFQATGCIKFGRNKSLFGIDAGYAYVKWDDRADQPVTYHLPAIALSYQYYATKSFHARFTLSSWQGLVFGIGKRF